MSEIKGIKMKRVRVPLAVEELKSNLITPFSAAEATADENYFIDRQDLPLHFNALYNSRRRKAFLRE